MAAFQAPVTVMDALRQAAADTGFSHYLGTFVGGQVVITSAAEGPHSPHTEDLVPGFDDGAHATALGKALLGTLTHDQRLRYLKDRGMRQYTSLTLTEPEALDVDIVAGDRRGLQTEISQFRDALGCAAVVVHPNRDPERRLVLACSMSADHLVDHTNEVRGHLMMAARAVSAALASPAGAGCRRRGRAAGGCGRGVARQPPGAAAKNEGRGWARGGGDKRGGAGAPPAAPRGRVGGGLLRGAPGGRGGVGARPPRRHGEVA